MRNGTQRVNKPQRRGKTTNEFNFHGPTHVNLSVGNQASLEKFLSELLDKRLKGILPGLSASTNEETERADRHQTPLTNHEVEANTPGEAESFTTGSGSLYSSTGSIESEKPLPGSQSKLSVVLEGEASCPPCLRNRVFCIIPFNSDRDLTCVNCDESPRQCILNERALHLIDMHRKATRHIAGDLDSMFGASSSKQTTLPEVHETSRNSLASASPVESHKERSSCCHSRRPSYRSSITPEGRVAHSIEVDEQLRASQRSRNESHSRTSTLRLLIPENDGYNVTFIGNTASTSE